MKDLCTCKIKTCDELEDDNPAALPSLDLIISLVAAGNIQEKMLDVDGWCLRIISYGWLLHMKGHFFIASQEQSFPFPVVHFLNSHSLYITRRRDTLPEEEIHYL